VATMPSFNCPPEVQRIIVSHCLPPTVLALCSVSRAWYAVAAPRFYSIVSVGDPRRAALAFRTLTSNRVLAAHVHTLWVHPQPLVRSGPFNQAAPSRSPAPEWWRALGDTLGALRALEHVTLHDTEGTHGVVLGRLDVPATLHTARVQFLWDENVADFVYRHRRSLARLDVLGGVAIPDGANDLEPPYFANIEDDVGGLEALSAPLPAVTALINAGYTRPCLHLDIKIQDMSVSDAVGHALWQILIVLLKEDDGSLPRLSRDLRALRIQELPSKPTASHLWSLVSSHTQLRHLGVIPLPSGDVCFRPSHESMS
jgi:hypothetical protein